LWGCFFVLRDCTFIVTCIVVACTFAPKFFNFLEILLVFLV